MSTEKEVTIYDIARKLNISSATVSRALNDDPVVSKKTKQKIFDLAEQMGYRTNLFARNLRNNRTNTIGVIIPRINSFFMSSVISGMEKVANQSGYNLIISQSSESVEKEIKNVKTLYNSRVDGLLVSLAYDTIDTSHFDVFFKMRLPLIFFDRVVEHEHATNIIIDNRKKAYEATQHLIDQGCRRILHVTAIPRQTVYVERLAGYKQALADHNIKFKEDYVIINDLSHRAGIETAAIIQAMNTMPDAVFVSNDDCAIGCMIALKKAGIRIPDDIAFVGFNNDPISTIVEPNLTTIDYPGYEMGVVAANNLINHLHLNGVAPIHTTNTIIIRSELIIRASSLKRK
ncbi:LacI family transcriptional regulator [Chitinophagaceae bacterium LB-8]|uniref:LacI family transcriptional regulator n=1 Tax=Paraflavisolibacter caeni TaxID=2982496 RepID=A0A9X2XVU3_9BACT|nr:LacI family DNA-binding transcriptional regulator [Paraflavisolibacter caeni]MCU7550136.1 LacI family transcriptional regulator [Paraflavisolibacter caeni]